MRKSPYQCVLFDLDHTLWDYESNSEESLAELFVRYQLADRSGSTFGDFFSTFITVNTDLWDRYDKGLIERSVIRTERFHRVLLGIGVDDYALSLRFSADYLEESPKKKNLIPGSMEILQYLSEKYPLYIVTNGFDEIQSVKMSSSGITPFFRHTFTSEKVGHNKPSRGIFDHVLREFSHQHADAIMVGDNLLTDMLGARNASIDHVFFNPRGVVHQEPVTYEIRHLLELRNIL
jgi:YjjG family noncanonical pyrimidine nucleotidase